MQVLRKLNNFQWNLIKINYACAQRLQNFMFFIKIYNMAAQIALKFQFP
jgi:hypothetical protein